MAKPCLPIGGIEFKQAAGIPLSKKELKNLFGNCPDLKSSIKQLLRVKDEEDAVNRYTWYNIPLDMKSNEIERLLYQRGQLILWYWKAREKFMLTPFALCEGLDEQGRYVYVNPVPICEGNDPTVTAMKAVFSTIKLKVVYDVQLEEDFIDENGEFLLDKAQDLVENSCVILYDRTPSISQNIVPRVHMQEGILDVMAECIPFARTALQNSTGVMGMRIPSEDELSNVYAANREIQRASLNGEKYVPIVGQVDFQELTGDTTSHAEEYLQAMQGLNNFRLSCYGLDNNGLYDKKAYVNNMQSGVSNVGLTMQDGLSNRQDFAAIADSIWDTALWCDISETVSGQDINMDGINYETNTIDHDGSVESNSAPMEDENDV